MPATALSSAIARSETTGKAKKDQERRPWPEPPTTRAPGGIRGGLRHVEAASSWTKVSPGADMVIPPPSGNGARISA